MTDTSVKFFRSDMANAPELLGVAGGLIAVLDACLVNGFGSVTLDSLVVASDVATGTVSTGHGFGMKGDTGPVIEISGASPSGLNGQWRLSGVPDVNTFTFATSGIGDQTAAGTVAAKRASAGWAKQFSSTGKAVYQRTALEATGMVLRVRDDHADDVFLTMHESMTDVDTGVGPSTVFDDIWANHEINGASPWALYADERAFYFISNNYGAYWFNQIFFGDIVSFMSADNYHAVLIGSTAAGYSSSMFMKQAISAASLIARDPTQTGGAVGLKRYVHDYVGNLGVGGVAYPNPAGGGLICLPMNCIDEGPIESMRGMMPGLYIPLHDFASLTDQAAIENVVGLEGRTLNTQRCDVWIDDAGVLFDITGPWR